MSYVYGTAGKTAGGTTIKSEKEKKADKLKASVAKSAAKKDSDSDSDTSGSSVSTIGKTTVTKTYSPTITTTTIDTSKLGKTAGGGTMGDPTAGQADTTGWGKTAGGGSISASAPTQTPVVTKTPEVSRTEDQPSDFNVKRIDANIFEVTSKSTGETKYAYVSATGETAFTTSLHRAQAHRGFDVEATPSHRDIARQAMTSFQHKIEDGMMESKYVEAGVSAGTLKRVEPTVSDKRIDIGVAGDAGLQDDYSSLLQVTPPEDSLITPSGTVPLSDVQKPFYADFLSGVALAKGDEVKFEVDVPDTSDIAGKDYWSKKVCELTTGVGQWWREDLLSPGVRKVVKDVVGTIVAPPLTPISKKDVYDETAGGFVLGAAQLPAGLVEMAGSTLYGAELAVRHPEEVKDVAMLAVGLTAGGMVKEFDAEMAGELTAGLLIGKAGKVSPIKYGKVALPEVTKVMSASARKPITTPTTYRGLFVDVPGTVKPIVGFKGLKPTKGAPLYDLPSGFVPASHIEASLSLATKRSKLTVVEQAKLSSRLKLMEELQYDKPPSPQAVKVGEQKYVPAEVASIIEKVIKSEKEHVFYGSATQKPQLGVGRLPKDIDIEVLSPKATASKILTELNKKYPGKYRIATKTPTIVEMKTKTGWHHMVDIHEIIRPGELIGYGLESQRPIQTGWQLQRPVGEQLVRKGERSIRYEHKGQLSPGSTRLKDVGDFHSIAERMIEHRRIAAEQSFLDIYGRHKVGKLETALRISKGEQVGKTKASIDIFNIQKLIAETTGEINLIGKHKPGSKAVKPIDLTGIYKKPVFKGKPKVKVSKSKPGYEKIELKIDSVYRKPGYVRELISIYEKPVIKGKPKVSKPGYEKPVIKGKPKVYESEYGYSKLHKIPSATKIGSKVVVLDLAGGYTDFVKVPSKPAPSTPLKLPSYEAKDKPYSRTEPYEIIHKRFTPIIDLPAVASYEPTEYDYTSQTRKVPTSQKPPIISTDSYEALKLFSDDLSKPQNILKPPWDDEPTKRRRKKAKVGQLDYAKFEHLIGDPLKILAGIGGASGPGSAVINKRYSDYSKLSSGTTKKIKTKNVKLSSGFISTSKPFGGVILTKANEEPSKKRSKRKKKQSTNVFNWL